MGSHDLDTFLAMQAERDVLRLITCGSVDDGKSSLIGRLLYESRQIFDDQICALQEDSRRHGTQGDAIDYALLVDGLQAEREQGITIDVAYRFMATDRRRFIIADTPGHQQYTRNMVTAASTASLAVLLVDARHGMLNQTRRHTCLLAMLGIRHVVLAINKMDLCGYRESVFQDIVGQFQAYAKDLNLVSCAAIPVSALIGDNIVQRSGSMPWYDGPTLLGLLETIDVSEREANRFVFPVQLVLRPHAGFRGFAGTVVEGSIRPGEAIRVADSGALTRVRELWLGEQSLSQANAGQSITITLHDEIDISRGDVLCQPDDPVATTDQFEATVVWMDEQPCQVGRPYELRLATTSTPVTLTQIHHRIDIDTMTEHPATELALNDIAVCSLVTTRDVPQTSFERCRALGGFILIDRMTHATVAAGMIRQSARRAQNVHRHALTVTREHREHLNGHAGRVIWLTGLPGSGKSTIANALEVALYQAGLRTFVLDGDNLRHGLNRDLGFTDADRAENIRRVAEVARLMLDAGHIVITAFISPFEKERETARGLIGASDFLEIYVNTPLAVCEARDPKGLYQKARAGQLANLSGIGSRYEPPSKPDLTVDTEHASVESIVHAIRMLAGC